MTDAEKAVIIEVLCSQSLADHLGDVRDAEEKLWKLLGAPELPWDHPALEGEGGFRAAAARLRAAGYELPEHLRDCIESEDGNA